MGSMATLRNALRISYFMFCILPCMVGIHLSGSSQSLEVKELKSTSITYPVLGPREAPIHPHGSRARRSLTPENAVFMVDEHNARRRLEPASDMEHMKWNDELAAMALEWARGCWWGHGQPNWNNKPFDQIGQNLYATTGQLDLGTAMNAWSDEEKVFYHYNTGACDKEPCGHYTQVVWSTSREVGCAQHRCPNLVNAFRNGNYLVCNYGPAGNFRGVKPFRIGAPCSQCQSEQFWCDNGLCRSDCTSNTNCHCGASCKNNGCVTSDCKCTCQDGFTGPDCSDVCEDKHAFCGANPGWPVSWCQHSRNGEYIRGECPLMCGICRSNSGRIGTCPTVTFSSPRPTTTTIFSRPPPKTSTYNPHLGVNKGVILETSTEYRYWNQFWESLRPTVTAALTDYCNTHATECCNGMQLQGNDVFVFTRDNVHIGLGYPRFGRYAGEQSTQLLIYATTQTVAYRCQSDTPQEVILRALRAAQSRLDDAIALCCDSVLLTMRYGEEPRANTHRYVTPTTQPGATNGAMAGGNFPVWAIAFIVIILVGAAVVFLIGGIYMYRRTKSQARADPERSATTNGLHVTSTVTQNGKPHKPEKPPKPAKPVKPTVPAKPTKPKEALKPILKENKPDNNVNGSVKDDVAANFNGLVQERIQGFDNAAYYNY